MRRHAVVLRGSVESALLRETHQNVSESPSGVMSSKYQVDPDMKQTQRTGLACNRSEDRTGRRFPGPIVGRTRSRSGIYSSAT